MRTPRLPVRPVDVVAVGFVIAQVVELVVSRRSAAGVAVIVLMVLAPGGLLLRHRVPIPAVVLSLGAFAALMQLLPSSLSSTFLAFLFVVGVTGSLSRVPAVVGLLAGWAVCFEGAWIDKYGSGVADFFMSAALLGGLWACGFVVARTARQARATAGRAEAAERSRRETADLAVRQERDRMTRELHDVVAHGLTVLVVQSVAARQELEDGESPELVARRLRVTEEVARESLLELRTLLGILGTHEEGPTATGVAGVRALVSRLSTPDFPIQLQVDADAEDLGHGVELALYRAVQEGLTNAVRHGDGHGASVGIGHEGGTIQVVVENGLSGRDAHDTLGAGRGLDGLRQRVAQHGGTLTAGAAHGRFVLSCELPTAPFGVPARP